MDTGIIELAGALARDLVYGLDRLLGSPDPFDTTPCSHNNRPPPFIP